jgi:hypothetical protein
MKHLHIKLLSRIDKLTKKLDVNIVRYNKGLKAYTTDFCETSLKPTTTKDNYTKLYGVNEMLKIPIKNVNVEFKQLYRKITAKTHPDKLKNNSKVDIYVKAVNSVKYNNWFYLIDIAKELNIDLPPLNTRQIKWLILLSEIIEQKLIILKDSIGWQYWSKNKKERIYFLSEQLKTKETKLL